MTGRRGAEPPEDGAVDGGAKFGGRELREGVAQGTQTSPDSSSKHVGMDLVDLYLPECFSFHSDTE